MKMLEILLEGRVEDFQTKYREKFSPETIAKIIDVSKEVPNGTKFLDFLGKVLPSNIAGGLLDEKVKETLKKFVSIGSNLEKKDINQYTTFAELYGAIEQYENRIRRDVKTIEGADLVYEDDKFTVVAPLTTKASCYYGAGTKWCTASSADNTHFQNYMTDGKLFYVIDKTKPSSDQFYKVAILKKFDGHESFFDAPDKSFTNGWIIGTKKYQKIEDAIKSYMQSKYKYELELYADKERLRIEKARIERERVERIRQEYLVSARERRQNNEWDPEVLTGGDEGSCAWALFNELVSVGTINELTPESKARLEAAEQELATLQETYDNIENAEEMTDLIDDISALEEEIEELSNLKDVYDMIPLDDWFYQLKTFTTTDMTDRWRVGDSAQVENSALESVKDLINDVGLEGFNQAFVNSHIDENEFKEFLENFFGDDIRDNPDAYLDDSERELSRSQVARINEINEEIGKLSEELNNLDDEDEDYDDEVSRIDSEIDELRDEITEIESDPEGDFDDEKIEEVISDRVSEYENNIERFCDDWLGAISVTEFAKRQGLIDMNDLIQDVVDTDGYGHTLNSYDGTETEQSFQGDTYYIFYDGDY